LFNVGDGGLDKACVAKADEISLIAKSEIDVKRGHIGRMKPEQMTRIIESVRYMLRDESLPAASPSVRS
jgi:mRNA-degrading endonuclease toxin of MazEF toxin-antitoxin module